MDPLYGAPQPPEPRRPPRVDAARAATWIIGAGLVLVVASIVGASLYSFRNSIYFGFGGSGQPDPSFWDRLQVFLQQSLTNLAFSFLVVAAGVALRVMVARPSMSPLMSPYPEPELPESPVELPERAVSRVVLVEPSPDDEIWRR